MITIIGMGAHKQPDTALLPLINQAHLLAGRTRHLSLFPQFNGQRLPLTGSIHIWIDEIIQQAQKGSVVVLADGDPLFYGMGKWFNRRLPSEELCFIPAPTALQQAFAAAGLEWGQALLMHVHRGMIPGLVSRMQLHQRMGFLTSTTNTPVVIARHLLDYNETGWRVWIAERLGAPDQRISQWSLEQLAELEDDHFDPLNVMLLDQPQHKPWGGYPMHCDDLDYQLPSSIDASMTRRNIRALATGLMHLTPHSSVWEIGAGAGTLSVEAAKIAYQGKVYCFEEHHDNAETCELNARRHRVDHLQVITHPFCDAITEMAPPDAVFIGIADSLQPLLLRHLLQHLQPGCRLVIPFRDRAALEQLSREFSDFMQTPEICQLQQGGIDRLEETVYLLHSTITATPAPGSQRSL